MVAESLSCPGCGDTVPPGRLSCPHCGEVLAAVAPRVVMTSIAPLIVASEPAQASAGPSVLADYDEDDDAEPLLVPDPEPYSPWPPPAAAPVVEGPAAPLLVPDPEPSSPWPPPSFAATPAPPVATPGAYVPPVPAPEPAPVEEVAAAVPASAPHAAPTPADDPQPRDPPPAAVFPRVWDPAAAAAGEGVMAAAPPTTVTNRMAVPRIDREKVEEVADAMMLLGAFGLALAFLAPWARVVIGSRGSGYMDTWGLAGSGHILLFLLVLAVLALGVVQNPIGRWLRTGVFGVALGAFVLGLAWPYVVGPLGAGPGAMLAWVSGVVMFIAGMVSLLVLRHAALPPDV
jgi:hypothetical protein